MPTVEPLPEIMTVVELAEFLRLDQRTVSLRLLRTGVIPAIKIAGKWRIPRQGVESYLAGGTKAAIALSGRFGEHEVNGKE